MGQRNFSLKSPDDASSEAIILSFDAKWLEALEAHSIDVVFRKMGPKTFTPKTLYAYLAMPISAIVARCPLSEVSTRDLEEAVTLVGRAGLSETELRAYAGTHSRLLIYELARIDMAAKYIEFDTLREDYDYWPSSNYIPLSASGIETLDKLGSFKSGATHTK